MVRKDIKGLVQEFFYLNPTKKMRVRQLERAIKASLPSVIRYCKELTTQEVLRVKKEGGVVFYTANRSSNQYLLDKRLYNLKQLYETGLIDYLRKQLHNPLIIVFGSYSKGEDIEGSDIDLYVETVSDNELILRGFEEKLQRSIQLFKHSSINDFKNQHLINNILNGVVLNGFLEVF